MKKIELLKGIFPVVLTVASACEVVDNDMEKHVDAQNDSSYVALQEVASILSAVPLEGEHLYEVHSAVTSSSGNGYDEEYTVRDMFSVPGKGVGENQTRSTKIYDNPLKSLIENHVRSEAFTKSAGEARNAEDFLNALMSSDIQIYWPFSEDWDGSALPVITFDPEDGSEVNIGYRIEVDDDGSRRICEIAVDEDLARRNPVWVVNRNEDAEYTSLEILRREDENWGEGGGAIILEPQSVSPSAVRSKTDGGAGDEAGDEAGGKTLILKEFTMKRNYDSWFAGASEFFVKVGSVEDFTATTEAEMKLYVPAVTDFMIVVKRSQVGKPQPFNAVLVSDWTDQMLNCAFLITEDDGGTRTDWNCTALVRVASKSYGVEMKIPFNSRDDIVWRGQLAAKWLQANSNVVGHFGDVDLTFEVVEYF